MKQGLSWNRVMYVAFSVAVTAGIFGYLFTHITVSDVVEMVRNADIRGVLMFLLLSFAMSVFRTWRYALVLKTAGQRAGSLALFLVVLVRNFASDLLPARIGTLVYVYIVTARLRIPFGAAASSFALAFLFDLVALVPLIALAAIFVGAEAVLSVRALLSGAVMLLVLVSVVLVALPRLVKLCVWAVERLNVLAAARRERWCAALRDAETEIARAKCAGIYLRLFVLSVLVRVTKYGALYVFLFALLNPRGYGFAQLNLPKVFIGLNTSEFAASLPISGIAGFGAYEGAWAMIFRLLRFPAHIADVTAVTHHLLTQVYGYLLGSLALLVLLLPLFQETGVAVAGDTPRMRAMPFYVWVLGFCVLIAFMLLGIYHLPVGKLT